MTRTICPRCGEDKLELLKTYGFCWECGYTPDEKDFQIPPTNFKAILDEAAKTDADDEARAAS